MNAVHKLTKNGARPPVKSYKALQAVWEQHRLLPIENLLEQLQRLVSLNLCRYPLFEGRGYWGEGITGSPTASYYTEVGMLEDPAGALADPLRLLCNGAWVHSGFVELLGWEGRRAPRRTPTVAWQDSPTGRRLGGKLVSHLLPHRRSDIATVLLSRLETGKWEAAGLPGPDFPGGGEIRNGEVIRDIYESGRGTLEVCPALTRTSNGRTALVGLPWGISWGDLLDSLQYSARDCGIGEIILTPDSPYPLLKPDRGGNLYDNNIHYSTTRPVEVRMVLKLAGKLRQVDLRELLEISLDNVIRALGSKSRARRGLGRLRRLRDPRRTVISSKPRNSG
jgi:hypothetical protein